MAALTFNQKFEGYWVDGIEGSLPKKSGVYCVYECIHNVKEKTVKIEKLIYIGESENVDKRISNHEKKEDWKKQLKNDRIICYSFTQVENDHRTRVEASLIFQHKPILNEEYMVNFPFDKTTIISEGANAMLDAFFTVNE